jgi:hypothetical protein
MAKSQRHGAVPIFLLLMTLSSNETWSQSDDHSSNYIHTYMYIYIKHLNCRKLSFS